MGEPTQRDMRGLSKCWQNSDWHVYGAGPCLDTYEQAIDYRERLDYARKSRSSRDEPWPPKPPADWVNPLNAVPTESTE